MTHFIQQLDDEDVREKLIEHIHSISATQRRKLLSVLEHRTHTRRKYNRKNCHRPIDYAVSGRFFKDVMKNIGAGGAFIETGNSFSIGQEVTLSFSLNGTPDDGALDTFCFHGLALASLSTHAHFKITGEIVWMGLGGIGVKFNKTNRNLTVML